MKVANAAQVWSEESSIFPYRASRRVPASALLVFAPHPDDEVFGCGGLLASMLDAGVPVRIVIVSDGAQGGDAAVREIESSAAALKLAASSQSAQLEFWRLPDRGVMANDILVQRMCAAIVDSGADWVLAPSPYEIHPDHRAVTVAATEAFALSFDDASKARLAFFEIGHPLLPDLLIDITPVLPRKIAAIRCFASQLAIQAYDEQVLGMNRFRSYTLGPMVTHAEAYQVLEPRRLHGGLSRVLRERADHVVMRLGLE